MENNALHDFSLGFTHSIPYTWGMAHKNKTNQSPYQPRSGRQAPTQRGRHRSPEKVYTFQEADDRMYDLFSHHGFGDYPHEKRHQLTRFYQLLMEKQRKLNITRLTKLRDVGIKHFIDSLIIPQLTTLQFPLMDLGTGPGFPGIPLKIHLPQGKIILAEGIQARVDFLKLTREELELEQLDIIGKNIDKNFTYPVRGVITRAVEDLSNTLEKVLYCLETGGRVYFMKGPKVTPEIAPALKKWGEYYKLIEDHAYTLPETPHERRLLVFEKTQSPPPQSF